MTGTTVRHLARATAGALALAALTACGGSTPEEAAAETTPPTVLAPSDVFTARAQDLTTGILLTGSLQPVETVTLTAQVSGTVSSLAVDRGSPVRRGQRLATIQAEGVRSQAAGSRANVQAARANVEVARKERDAAQRLHEAGAISAIEAQQAAAALEAAQAQLAAAQAQAVAADEEARRTVIVSPLTGAVSARAVEQGEAVSMGDPILTVVNTSALELEGRIPVEQAGAVRVGQPVRFTLDAFPGRTFEGTVARKDPAADPATRQVGVFVRLPNPDGEIVAGQFARGRIAGRVVRGAVVVPTTAVQGSGEEAVVWLVEGGQLVRRPVRVGARDDAEGLLAIEEGLAAGDVVLARPTPQVVEGMRVTIAADSAAAGARAGRAPAGDTTGAADTAARER